MQATPAWSQRPSLSAPCAECHTNVLPFASLCHRPGWTKYSQQQHPTEQRNTLPRMSGARTQRDQREVVLSNRRYVQKCGVPDAASNSVGWQAPTDGNWVPITTASITHYPPKFF